MISGQSTDGSLLALASPENLHRIQCYNPQTPQHVKFTLLDHKPHQLDVKQLSNLTNGNGNGGDAVDVSPRLRKLEFVGTDTDASSSPPKYLVALVDHPTHDLYVWDLERGLVSCRYALEGTLLDICCARTTTQNHTDANTHTYTFYGLVEEKRQVNQQKKTKLTVHQFSISNDGGTSIKLMKKIKAGHTHTHTTSTSSVNAIRGSLAVRSNIMAVYIRGRYLRLNHLDGSKVARIELEDTEEVSEEEGGDVVALSEDATQILISSTGTSGNNTVSMYTSETDSDEWKCIRTLMLTDGTTPSSLSMDSQHISVVQPSGVSIFDTKQTTASCRIVPRATTHDSVVFASWQQQTMLVARSNSSNTVEMELVPMYESETLKTGEIVTPCNDEDDKLPSAKRSKGNEGAAFPSYKVLTGDGDVGTEMIHDEPDEEASIPTDRGTSIADRLRMLSQQYEENDTDDESTSHDNENTPTVTITTPASLKVLLTQALQSSDDSQLEIAISTQDPTLVSRSIQQLAESHPPLLRALLAKCVHRMSTTPSQSGKLTVWLEALLTEAVRLLLAEDTDIGDGPDGIAGNEKKVLVKQLGVLRGWLKSRTETLTDLLLLEGRLTMISNN